MEVAGPPLPTHEFWRRPKKETGNLTRTESEDLGFKVFKLAESNFVSWSGTAERDPEKYHKEMSLFVDPLRAGWTADNVLWEVAIKEGYGLNSVVEQVACEVNTVYRVVDSEKDPPQSFRACLDETLHPDIAKALELTADDLFVCRDRALDDTLAANLALQCRLKTI
jgi:adenine-specific DNA-methyltransferase